jgi:hypothetical protein
MRLTFHDSIGSLRFRRYQHARRGVIETLTNGSVVYVRPCFASSRISKPKPASIPTQRKVKPRRNSAGRSGR